MGIIHKEMTAEAMRKEEHKEESTRGVGGKQGIKDILESPCSAEEQPSTLRRCNQIEKK